MIFRLPVNARGFVTMSLARDIGKNLYMCFHVNGRDKSLIILFHFLFIFNFFFIIVIICIQFFQHCLYMLVKWNVNVDKSIVYVIIDVVGSGVVGSSDNFVLSVVIVVIVVGNNVIVVVLTWGHISNSNNDSIIGWYNRWCWLLQQSKPYMHLHLFCATIS